MNAATLVAAGIIRRELDGVRVLAKGELKEKLDFDVAGMSKVALEAVEKLGGKVTITAPLKRPNPKSRRTNRLATTVSR